MSPPEASLAIPAHNEARLITRCLTPLLPLIRSGWLQVVVASNGSDDGTAQEARTLLAGLPNCSVLEIDEPSKVRALRESDAALSAFPRVYLDADVQIDAESMVALVTALKTEDRPLVGAPTMVVERIRSSWMVRSYYDIWTSLPYVTEGVIGSGVYGLNRPGRTMLGEFPDTLNDDGWIRRSFEPANRLRTDGEFLVYAPLNVVPLIRRRARIATGNRQLDSRMGSDGGVGAKTLLSLVRRRQVKASGAAVFVALTVASKVLGRWLSRGTRHVPWASDQTARRLSTPSRPGEGTVAS